MQTILVPELNYRAQERIAILVAVSVIHANQQQPAKGLEQPVVRDARAPIEILQMHVVVKASTFSDSTSNASYLIKRYDAFHVL